MAEKCVLIGSAAIGTHSGEREHDLVVIARKTEEASKQIRKYESEREIAPVVQSPEEYVTARSSDKVFYNRVAEGITLYEKEPDEQRL